MDGECRRSSAPLDERATPLRGVVRTLVGGLLPLLLLPTTAYANNDNLFPRNQHATADTTTEAATEVWNNGTKLLLGANQKWVV